MVLGEQDLAAVADDGDGALDGFHASIVSWREMGGWHSQQMLDYYDMAAHGRRGQAGQSLQNYLTE